MRTDRVAVPKTVKPSSASRANAKATVRLPLPAGVVIHRIDWPVAISILVGHLLALIAFVPWTFSWTGVILAIVAARVMGLLGINICYHRLLTHRGFKCPKWFEHVLAVIAIGCVQDTPARWVAVHRLHHQHTDEQCDPHSPLVNFLWSHVGWLVLKNPDLRRLKIYDRYAKDILRDPFYAALERDWLQLEIILLQWAVFFGAGFLAEVVMGGAVMDAVQFGASILIWGVFVRTVVVWHQTWAVNSVAHLWGYRNYQTDEDSRNNIIVGVLAHGEGWHNNHHADPRSARHGHKWWELDTTWLTIRLFEKLGLATDVVGPSPLVMSKVTCRPPNTIAQARDTRRRTSSEAGDSLDRAQSGGA
ncbi:Delta 9 acyl-lipid fatty acid desaturase [Bradyrhizobium sp. STM 3843]|nr:Delta 9 acyl-lipid fatty acid desaturase [Bradyrhizobium sp. STM 3843]